jgi:hypothetical protein
MLCEIHGGQSGTGAGFTLSLFDFALKCMIPSLLHTYLSSSQPGRQIITTTVFKMET